MTIAPIVSLVLLYVVFFGDLIFSARQLPERMATHFRFDMLADGWMKRSSYLAVMTLIAVGVPLALLGVVLPVAGPNHALLRFMLWTSCLLLGFFLGVHKLTVRANRQAPEKLSALFWGLLLLFFAGIGLCVTLLAWGKM